MHKATILAGVVTALLAGALVAPATATAEEPRLTGVVLAPSGAPAADIPLTDVRRDLVAGTTDAQGRFDLPDPGATTRRVYLCAKLAQSSPLGGAAGWSNACGYVTPGVNATLRFRTGTAIGGVVTDVRSGRPLDNATVSVVDSNDGSTVDTVTDATGHWTYRNLVPGVMPHAPSSAQKVSPAAPNGYAAVGPERTDVVMRAGQARDDIGIQVAPVVVYSGTVVDELGTPSSSQVAVRTYDTFAQVPTDPSGGWNLRAPWSGAADLCVWQAASEFDPRGVAVTCSVVRSTALSVSTRSTLSATPGSILRGAVVGTDGRTVGIADVTAEVPVPTGGTLTLHGNRKGSVWDVASLPAGTYTARATAITGRDGTVVGLAHPVAVGPGRTTRFSTITLTTGGN